MEKQTPTPSQAAAQAQPNIALIKYWGKRDIALNLPAAGSLSITLESLWTRTRVAFDPALERDRLHLNGAENADQAERASACLDLLRARAGVSWRAQIDSHNNFPTGAGLASSASGFAALVRAAAAALDLDLEARELSILARRGSGSAARSIFGGFVEMAAGTRADGEDAFAQPVLDAAEWPLQVVVAVTSKRAKSIGSTAGMELSRRTSPFYADYVATTPGDLGAARRAVPARDFEALATLSEHSCLKMHGMMLATQPGLLYWSGATVECLHRVRTLREQEGVGVFFTVDAGPQVKAICLPDDAARVAAALADVPGVEEIMTTGLGEGARVIEGALELSCAS
ncbi:MAG TPA: diphosphomevalonate decarboxylase [Gammaproteobacteria bacterium]|nr:diphosphomevalonate decarboxylase [Gammaproteobacteria bacterium]